MSENVSRGPGAVEHKDAALAPGDEPVGGGVVPPAPLASNATRERLGEPLGRPARTGGLADEGIPSVSSASFRICRWWSRRRKHSCSSPTTAPGARSGPGPASAEEQRSETWRALTEEPGPASAEEQPHWRTASAHRTRHFCVSPTTAPLDSRGNAGLVQRCPSRDPGSRARPRRTDLDAELNRSRRRASRARVPTRSAVPRPHRLRRR